MKQLLKVIRRHPLRVIFLFGALSVLLGLEIWDHFSPLPARDWIAVNFERIRITDPDNFCFAVFGDNKNSHLTFEKLLDDIDRDPEISFALALGDLVYDGEKEKYRLFLKQVKHHLQKPLLTAIGNHEVREDGRGLYAEIFGPFYYSFRIGKVCFFVLDDADKKGLDLWQRLWLEREFKRTHHQCKQRLVFFHVPLYDPRGGNHRHCLPEESARDLLNFFQNHGVSHIFSSHIHGFFQGNWSGIPYTITGGAGAELVGTDLNHYFFHYLKVRVVNGNLQVEVKRLPSPKYERLDRLAYALWLYVYAFLSIHGVEMALLLISGMLCISLLKGRNQK